METRTIIHVHTLSIFTHNMLSCTLLSKERSAMSPTPRRRNSTRKRKNQRLAVFLKGPNENSRSWATTLLHGVSSPEILPESLQPRRSTCMDRTFRRKPGTTTEPRPADWSLDALGTRHPTVRGNARTALREHVEENALLSVLRSREGIQKGIEVALSPELVAPPPLPRSWIRCSCKVPSIWLDYTYIVYIFYMSANSNSNIASLYIELFGIQLDGKESWLLDHCLANTTMRDYALSMGIQVIMNASMYPDSINTICSFHII